jgi:EamA domain-containing membrane protein RarD
MPLTNLGIVLFSSIAAMVVFKEKLSKLNWIGLLLGALSIGMLLNLGWA